MNREIKFRGIAKDSGEWIIGSLIQSNGETLIFPEDAPDSYDRYIVRPETVGQFTGLKDKNGVDIYEGDIVNILYTDWGSQDNFVTSEVVFEDCEWCLDDHKLNKYGERQLDSISPGTHGWIIVIDSIHTNPDLINQ